jgi:hypothetical protein
MRIDRAPLAVAQPSARWHASCSRDAPGRMSGRMTEDFPMGSQFPPTTDAIELLKADHREVEELFRRFEAAEESDKVVIAQEICQALTVHAHIEEQLFYPSLRGKVDDDILDEAVVEHTSLKELIAKIDGARPQDELFEAHVKVLEEYVKHHVKEEETEMMPQARAAGASLQGVGEQIKALKSQLEDKIAEIASPPGNRVEVLEVDGRGVRHPQRGGRA